MSTHPDFYWHAGDDWQISATLLDNTGLPFDLSGTPDIRWALVSEKTGETVLTEADVNVIVVGEPAEGTCAVQVPHAVTGSLAAGCYRDVLRISYIGIRSALAYGANWVSADPWAVSP